jgi:hypothetical protein
MIHWCTKNGAGNGAVFALQLGTATGQDSRSRIPNESLRRVPEGRGQMAGQAGRRTGTSRSDPEAGRDGAEGEEMTGPRLFPTKPWTPEEDERLKSMIFAGRTAVEAAIKLGRTVGAVHAHARVLRLSFKRIAMRREIELKGKGN